MDSNFIKQKTAAELRELLQNGESNAKAALASLFDGGSFAELGAYIKRVPGELESAEMAEFEGVVTGYGAVNGRLTFAFIQDSSKNKGAFGASHAEKIIRLYDAAIKNEAPVVGIFDSNGAFVLEGVGALAGYGKLMKKVNEACGLIPQIAVISGKCGGSAAVIASMFDFTIAADDKGEFYVNPPFIAREQLKDKALGTAKYAAESGAVDLTAADTAAAIAKAKEILSAIPQSAFDGLVIGDETDNINRLTPELEGLAAGGDYDMKALIAAVSDAGKFVEIGDKYAPEMVCGFASFNALSVGVVASQPKEKNGALTEAAALKAAAFIDFCGRFDIPLLTLADSCGCDLESEKGRYPAALASLAAAYTSYDNPKVTVITGETYGAAYTLLGSKSLGVDVALALDCASVAAMSVEAAVQFTNGKKIASSKDPAKEKAAIAEKFNDVLASPLAAARAGELDDIIAYEELRQRITSSFELLTAKYGG